jgi:phenylacetate-CoA ligase
VECATDEDNTDYAAISQKVTGSIKSNIMISSEVDLVAYGDLPRSERKSKRFFDNRP